MILLIQYTLVFASVLVLVALGGCFSEHSGVINLGLEGIMVMGALGGALALSAMNGSFNVFLTVIISVACAIGAGLLYSVLLAVACVNLKADQTLIGTAMNILATALAVIIVKALNMANDADNVSSIVSYHKSRGSLIFHIGSMELNWYMVIAVIVLVAAFVVLYRTRFGLRLMACGENPSSADSVGINVYKYRWAGVLISGALGGLGGLVYVTAGVSEWKFEVGVAGFGFLALAVMIFGQWKPHRIGMAALLFGFFRALSNVYAGFPWLVAMNIPGSVYNMLPYIISLLVLAFTSKNSAAPKAEGVPYDKSTR